MIWTNGRFALTLERLAPERLARDLAASLFRLVAGFALVVAAYAGGQRPEVPFPYYAEAFTGLEYTALNLSPMHDVPIVAIQGRHALDVREVLRPVLVGQLCPSGNFLKGSTLIT